MRPPSVTGIRFGADISRMVNPPSPSPRPYGERVGVRGSNTHQSKRLPLTLTLSPCEEALGEGIGGLASADHRL